jgi:hypothetical protein
MYKQLVSILDVNFQLNSYTCELYSYKEYDYIDNIYSVFYPDT